MKHLTFQNGDQMPIVGLGTWKSRTGDGYRAVSAAIEAGFRHIDCARIYDNQSEIGQAINDAIKKGFVRREDLWVTSKLWNSSHLRADVRPELEQTLVDLGLEYLDLYLMHWPVAMRPEVIYPSQGDHFLSEAEAPLEETWEALEEAIKVQTQLYRYQPVNSTFEDLKSTGNLNLLSQPKQHALLKLSYFQNTRLLIDEKLMESFYNAAVSAEAIIERRSMAKGNSEGTILKRSGMPFQSVFEIFGIREKPERLAQGLIYRQNMLIALLNYHQVGVLRARELLQLSRETIEIMQQKNDPQ